MVIYRLFALGLAGLTINAYAHERPAVSIKEQYAQVNQSVVIKSTHSVDVLNETGHSVNYYFTVETCAQNHPCNKYTWQKRLDPNGYYRSELVRDLQAQFKRTGDKDIWASTLIKGDRDFIKTEHSRVRVS